MLCGQLTTISDTFMAITSISGSLQSYCYAFCYLSHFSCCYRFMSTLYILYYSSGVATIEAAEESASYKFTTWEKLVMADLSDLVSPSARARLS